MTSVSNTTPREGESPFTIDYDKMGDVLYITISAEPASSAIEDKNGLVWRMRTDGTLVGLTIPDLLDRIGVAEKYSKLLERAHKAETAAATDSDAANARADAAEAAIADARRKALEEAAVVCDAYAKTGAKLYWKESDPDRRDAIYPQELIARHLAKEIRSLSKGTADGQ